MKKLFLLTLAAAVLSFAGCQKNEFEDSNNTNEGESTFELIAEIVHTKTTLDGLAVEWEDGDIIYMVTKDEEWGAAYSSENNNLTTIAEFVYADGKFTTESTISSGEHTFNAMYTRGDQKTWHRGAGSSHSLLATQTQDCTNPTAHIKENDALVGTFTATIPMAEPASVTMSHLYTMMQVDVKNNTGNALEITKFEMTAANADLAGVFNVTAFDTPAISTESGASSTIAVNVTGGNVAAGESLPVYFVMAPLADYSGDVTFKVTDASGNTYTKTVTLASITFAAGEYNTTPYTISIADEVAADVYGLVEIDGAFENDGKYILAFKDGEDGTYAFINNNGTSETAIKDALEVTGGTIVNPSSNYVFTAVASGDGFTFKNSAGNFIYNSGSNTTLNTNNSSATVWTPTFLTASATYKLVAKRYIAFNGTNKAMGYAESNFKDQVASGLALAQYAGAISVFKLNYTPVITPKILVAETNVTVLADSEYVEIPYSTENINGVISAVVNSDVDGMVRDTPAVESDKVIVYLNANETDNEKNATITLSYDGAEDVVVFISQYAEASIEEGLASLYTIVTSTNSSTPDEFAISVTNAVVTYVSGSTAFIEDSTAGMLIYKSSHGLNAGDMLSGTLTGKAYVRYGVCQISDFDFVGETAKGTVPVTTITLADLMENYDSYISRRVKIENATVTDGVTGTSDKNGTISQDGTSVNLYNNNSSVSFVKDDFVDFIAYPSYYNATKQLATYESPVSKKVAAPSISCSNNVVSISCETADVTIYYAVNDGDYQEYIESFTIESDCTVNAYAHKEGFIDSEEVTVSLTWTDPNAGGGDTTEPVTLVIDMDDYVEDNNCTISSGNNVTNYKTLTLDNVISMVAGGTGANEGSFWSGVQWRLYQNGNGKVTVSAADGYTIQTVKFTYSTSNNGVLKNGSTNVTSGTEVTVNDSSITLTVGNTGSKTNGQVRITDVTIVYVAE